MFISTDFQLTGSTPAGFQEAFRAALPDVLSHTLPDVLLEILPDDAFDTA